ncbi:hypothetical protein [Rickettsiella endosymbiont of Miltochrista miniata]|uniref:hypothetical protein n=1 Tax=Rickettsiella endosymbiont of Miltochrista miniata TaxID=3066239 RepID=UPI00313D3D91
MKDNCYAYVIDASLEKGKTGNYSKPLVFECQPLLSSNLGGSSKWSYKNAFAKAFPDANMTIDIQGNKTKVYADNLSHRKLIKNSENVSTDEFIKISQGKYYKHVHTGSFEVEIDKLNNKVYQRLYLPDEVSPEYRILQSKTATEKLAEDIFNYFSTKRIAKIVLKSAVGHEGKGNIFINDIQDKEALKKDIENIKSLNQYQPDANTKYFLAEEQKEHPHVNRETDETKPGHVTYRLVGITSQEGDLGHFIATKSNSASLDSHQRGKMKCYFGTPGKTHVSKVGWSLQACGPKDKYFGKGDNKVDIDPILMNKLSKRMYQLYADIKTMSDENFEEHIDQLVILKNVLGSREEKITHFAIEEKTENELINTPNLVAYSRAAVAYPRLAASIASEMVETKTVDLSELAKLPCYNNEDIEPFLNAMRQQKQFDGLKTANTEQLNYCVKEYACQDMQIPKKAKELLIEKNSQKPEKQVNPVPPPQMGTSNYHTRLQHAFFADNAFGEASGSTSSNNKETGNLNLPNSVSRLAGLSLFTTPQAIKNENEKNSEKQKKHNYAK